MSAVTRQDIVEAAIELIHRDTLAGLTMEKLSDRVQLELSALTELFGTREALLDAIVDAVVDELYADPDVQPASQEWQEYLERVAHGVRRIALAHPQVFPLIATRPPSAPWLHPPLRSLRWMEIFFETLKQSGFSDRAAVAAYRAFSSFLLGHLLLEVSALGVDVISVGEPDPQTTPSDDLADYPRLRSMQEELTINQAGEEFGDALESLLDRLEGNGIR